VDQAMVGEVGRYGDASGDLSSDVVEAVCGQVQHQMELSLSKEQCFCIAKILQHVHEIVVNFLSCKSLMSLILCCKFPLQISDESNFML